MKQTTVSTLLHLAEELRQFTQELLPLGTKYSVERYLRQVKELVEPAEAQRNELVLSLSGGSQSIPSHIDGVLNPIYEEYSLAWADLLKEPVDLPSPVLRIPLEKIESIETTKTYPTVFEYCVEDTTVGSVIETLDATEA